MSQIDRILTFLKVIEAGSFSSAGRKLGISKAAVSKQVSLLEEELGAELLLRSTRHLKLTEAGEQFYEQGKKLSEQLNDLEFFMQGLHVEPVGRLKVTSARHFGLYYVVPHLAEFYKLYPKVIIDLELAERIPDMDKENIDILIGMSISGPPNAIQRKINETRYVLCASREYLRKNGVPQKPDDLHQYHYIAHTSRRPDNMVPFSHASLFLKPSLYLNDTEAMRISALNNMGIIRVHKYVVEEDLKRGELVEILKEYQDKEVIPLYLCYRQSLRLPSKIRKFIDFTLEKIESINL